MCLFIEFFILILIFICSPLVVSTKSFIFKIPVLLFFKVTFNSYLFYYKSCFSDFDQHYWTQTDEILLQKFLHLFSISGAFQQSFFVLIVPAIDHLCKFFKEFSVQLLQSDMIKNILSRCNSSAGSCTTVNWL